MDWFNVKDGEYQVVAPYFTAFCKVQGGKIVDVAPILRWTLGKSAKYVFHWFSNREFKWHKLKA